MARRLLSQHFLQQGRHPNEDTVSDLMADLTVGDRPPWNPQISIRQVSWAPGTEVSQAVGDVMATRVSSGGDSCVGHVPAAPWPHAVIHGLRSDACSDLQGRAYVVGRHHCMEI